MRKLASSAAALMISLTTVSAVSSELVVALPETYPGDATTLKTEMWDVFLSNVGPDTSYRVINGTSGKQAAHIKVPDDEKYDRVRWRIKQFAKQNAEIGGLLERYQDGVGTAQIDIPAIMRNLGDNRLNNDGEIDLLIVGSPVHLSETESHFSMRNSDSAFLIPSDAHITGSLSQTPYGTAGRESGLKNVSVHFCTVTSTDDWNSAYSEAIHRFWSHSIAQQGGKLVTWTDSAKSCFERFKAKARNTRVEFAPLDDKIALAMLPVSREQVETLELGRKALKDIVIDEFNVFPTAPHPWVSNLEVVTGIKYRASEYPQKFQTSWCYFNRVVGGVQIKIDVGTMEFGEKPKWLEPSESTLNSAKISRTNVIAARDACQFPV